MLQYLEMMSEAVIPTLRAEGPELGVAPNKDKETRKNEAERPCVANRGPAVADIGFRQNEKSCKYDKKSGQMMIEFAFSLVRHQFRRHCGIHFFFHGHGHGRVHILRGMVLRVSGRTKAGREQNQKRERKTIPRMI